MRFRGGETPPASHSRAKSALTREAADSGSYGGSRHAAV